MARDVETVRKEINEMMEKIESATHYELLGLERESFEKSQVAGAFRNMAKKWHVDRFSNLDLGPDKDKVQKIFAAINTAQSVLGNDSKREEYDFELDGESAADIAQIFESENLFLKGKNILKQGAYKGAYDHFVEAHALNDQDTNIYVHMLYTEYLMIPKNTEGKPLKVTRAEEIADEFKELTESYEDSDWFKVFHGTVLLGLGKDRKAGYLFREALMINSNNMDAKRQQRLMEMRAEREANKGFFAKLMDKIKGNG